MRHRTYMYYKSRNFHSYLQMKGFNGILATCLASGIGLLRVAFCRPNITIDIVPADRTIAALTTLAWYQATLQARQTDCKVYNYVSCNDNRVYLQPDFIDPMAQVFETAEESCDKFLWKSGTIYTGNMTVYHILMYIFHCIPAVVFTATERLTGRQPVIMKLYRKIFFLAKTIAYFSINDWSFENDNTRAMLAAVTDHDRTWCDSSMDNFHWDAMFSNIPRVVAKYMLHSPLTKEHYQSKMVYIFHADFCLQLCIKAIALYCFLSFTAKLLNSYC